MRVANQEQCDQTTHALVDFGRPTKVVRKYYKRAAVAELRAKVGDGMRE
jgi:hypothetical protein